MKKRLKIFGIPWHLSHQHDLFQALKDDCDFYLMENTVRYWDTLIRPIPDNVKFVQYYEPGKYDLAILHLDQQCTYPVLGKGQLYRDLNKVITDIPKIVINHGTPMIPEYGYSENIVINGGWVKKGVHSHFVEGMKALIGDNFMVVNSYKAKERWGWGYPIWHGKNPDEYLDLPKEPRIVTMISAGGMDKYYNRMLLRQIREELARYNIPLYQITVDWHMYMDREHEGFDAYRHFLGKSLIYLNPTLDAPMPRARAEAMLSGCCVITTSNHDEEKFIKHGYNGFLIANNSPVATAKFMVDLLNESGEEANYYKMLIEVGQRGKKTAKELFTMKKYRENWLKVINTCLELGSKEAQEALKNGKKTK